MFTVKESVLKWGAALGVLAVSAMFWACSDDKSVAGGSTEDAGIIANLNVAGLTQKGPFVKGSEVTVQGIDCKTLKFTDEIFEGKVKSDKGDFAIDGVSLKSTCALFEVTGKYRNELTGKKSSEELTLHALTNLKDRKNVNINVLTELEYERGACREGSSGRIRYCGQFRGVREPEHLRVGRRECGAACRERDDAGGNGRCGACKTRGEVRRFVCGNRQVERFRHEKNDFGMGNRGHGERRA